MPDPIDELPVPYIEVNGNGIITRVNQATNALHDASHGPLVGQLAWQFIATSEKEASFANFVAHLESGERPAPVLRGIYDASGQFRTYQLFRSLKRDATGQPCGMRIVAMDLTETQQQLEKSSKQQRWLKSLLTCAPEAMLATDTMGFITDFNPEAEKLLGWRAVDVTGLPIEHGMPIVSYNSPDGPAMHHGLALTRPTRGNAVVLDRRQRPVRVELSTAPVLDPESDIAVGVIGVLRPLRAAHPLEDF